MSGHSHGHMAASGSLIVCVNDFAIFQDTDAGCTAAHIYNGAVCNFEDSSGSGRLVYDIGNLKTCTFQDITDAFDTAFRNSRRDGSSTVSKFCAKPFLQLIFKLCHKLDRFIVIDDHSILDRMGWCGNSGYGTVIPVDNGKNGIGSTKVDTCLQTTAEFFTFTCFYKFCKIGQSSVF